MLRNPSSILKACAAFALLQVSVLSLSLSLWPARTQSIGVTDILFRKVRSDVFPYEFSQISLYYKKTKHKTSTFELNFFLNYQKVEF